MPEYKINSFFNLKNFPKLVILFVLLFYCFTNFTHRNWTSIEGPQRGVIKWDVISYYAYLPAVFIHRDISLDFTDGTNLREDGKFWYQDTKNGNKVIMTTMGMSFLYAPFFFTSHILAPVFGQAQDGFQPIYQFLLVFSALFYLAIGFYSLWKLLSRFFPPGITALSLLLIGIGTNLYYFSTYEAAQTHSYSFALISVLFLLVIKWYEKPNWKRSLFVGFLFGLIALIRPTNLILLIPITFLGVGNIVELRTRLRFLMRSVPYLIIILSAFMLPWIPQILYWKKFTGMYLYSSFAGNGNGFYFGNPHIFDFLVSYRKGWFVYTPLMILAVIGFVPLYKIQRGLFYPLLAYLLITVFVLSSWWSWWYGGGFGMRPIIDLYGLMAIPLAALLVTVSKLPVSRRIVLGLVLSFLVLLNVFQTYQYNSVLIHWNSMTKKSYWTIFLRSKDRYGYWQNLTEPDLELARKGIYVYYPVIRKNERLLEMNEEEGREYVLYNLRKDRSLIRDIKRYAGRTDTDRLEALDMVADRAYRRLTEE